MKARKVKKKILNRTMDFFPYEFGNNYVLLQSAYGSRNLVRVTPSFYDGILRWEIADAKKKAKQATILQ